MHLKNLTVDELSPAVQALMQKRYGDGIYETINPHFFAYTDDGAQYSFTVQKSGHDWRITTTASFSVLGDGTLHGVQ